MSGCASRSSRISTVQDAGLAVRDIEKKLNTGPLKSTLTRLRNLTRAG